MKKSVFLFFLCFTLASFFSIDSFSQSIAGSYESLDKEYKMEVEEVPNSKKLTATIKGVAIPEGGSTNKIKLKGRYKLVTQQGEEIYLITFHGMGKWKDSNNNKFPIAFTLSGFMSKMNPTGITSQFAAAYEFTGNAEAVTGDFIRWTKL